MNVRIARRSNDQRGTVDLPQTVLHPIAINHPVAFRRHLAGPQRVDHEALQQIDIIKRVERLPARPEFGKMQAVGARLDIVDDARALVLGAPRGIDERTGRQNQRADARRRRSGHFDRDHRTGMMADDRGARLFQRIKQRERALGPQFNRGIAGRGIGIPEAERIHRDRAEIAAEQRQHIAVLVPRARRLMQQQDGKAVAADRDVQLAGSFQARPGIPLGSTWTVTSAVSTSPASPNAGSTCTAPRANTSTTSLPVTNRAISKSWIVMSRKMPPETRT